MFTRRSLHAAGLTALIAALAARQAAAETPKTPSSTAGVEPPNTPSQSRALDPAMLAGAQESLALQLIAQLSAGAADKNIAVSPMSLTAALAIICYGLNASKRAAFAAALQFDKRAPTDLFKKLLDAVVQTHSTAADYPLLVADRLVLDDSVHLVPAIFDGLQQHGVEVSARNLADPKVVAEINDWVKAATKQLIPQIIDQSPGKGGFVALNALYFKDRWKHIFDAKLTATKPFQLAAGGPVDVPMMSQEGSYLLRETDQVMAIDLPFATDRFGLSIVTTLKNPAKATDLIKLLRNPAGWLIGGGFVEGPGALALPRLAITDQASLLGPLEKLAPKIGGDLGIGDNPAIPVKITEIAQRTVLKLDEEGAQAAAATAVLVERSLSTEKVRMIIDKPFLFALRDKTTGFILLAGYVGRPEVAKA